ncbi:MAG: cryptochrome/photolyase family protein [Bacteroidota bacterium]
MKTSLRIMWFRRDLRLFDNAALYAALSGTEPVLPIFIFDRHILDMLENKQDRRVEFIHRALEAMQEILIKKGSSLEVYHGNPMEVFQALLKKYQVTSVYTNHDYEPYAMERDEAIGSLLQQQGIEFHTFKDQVIFEKSEVVKDDGLPYTVFTPYANKWRAKLQVTGIPAFPAEKKWQQFYQQAPVALPTLQKIGFQPVGDSFPPSVPADAVIQHYREKRDLPALPNGTSHLGIHLRFGTISIRQLATRAQQLSATYLNELIWRDFYHMILFQFPRVGKGQAFKKAYDSIPWRNREDEFKRWCEGTTGYPIVDAGMRQLNATGYMHNRVRMIVASFLAKHLLIDWRWGEAYFAAQLNDFDLAANNGGWQWAAGSGCDAAPYFRVFNPTLQAQKFDPKQAYIRTWVPEWQELTYPAPMVPHDIARKRALEVYGKALKGV